MKLNKETDAYKNKLKYIKSYNKRNLKNANFYFNVVDDKDVIDYIAKQPNKTDWLRKLVRKEMNK